MDDNVFREKLKYLLKTRRWSQGKLAKRADVPQSNISMFLTGNRPSPSLEFAYKIAKALKVSLDWLTGLKEQALDTLPSDEQELLHLYHAIPELRDRRIAIESIRVHAEADILEVHADQDTDNED